MLKVIFINLYTLYDKDIPLYYPGSDAFFRFGMGAFIAEEFTLRNYPLTFENWRMDLRIGEYMEKTVDGLKCRVFPSKRRKWLSEYSASLFKALKNEAGNKEVVFHFIGAHNRIYHLMARVVRKNKIISTHIGGANPYWLYKNERSKKALINYLLEKIVLLKPYDHFLSSSRSEIQYFEMLRKGASHLPVFGIPMLDQLTIRNRCDERRQLGLPLDKKILLQVGRATKARGFDWIIPILDELKNVEDYFFVFVGVHEEDEYYQELKERKVYLRSYLPRQELAPYYNAADVLFYLPNGKMDLEFAGTSYVPLEALACGAPVVATTLRHFPGAEIEYVARIPEKKEDVIPMIQEILSLNISRQRCREVVLKHFSWDNVIAKHWQIYNAN
jgi:glycosyltransferase involved in cell wall biosynthesis